MERRKKGRRGPNPHKKGSRRGRSHFWNKEYGGSAVNLAISTEPSEDMLAFLRFLERGKHDEHVFSEDGSVLDLGCGNGRNIIYLSKNWGIKGAGIDISEEGIHMARKNAEGLPLSFLVGSIAGGLPFPDESQTLILDMMASHVLAAKEREKYLKEVLRVLKPGGFLFLKTFLLDEDRNAARLLREHPGPEPGTYVHPKIGIPEKVFTEEELLTLLEKYFVIHRVKRSHRHLRRGAPGKRRTISVYGQKA